MLFALTPHTEGAILIDSIDIAKVSVKDLRRCLSVIPQTPFIFSATMRSNLDPLNLHTDAEIWDCLRIACLDNVVEAFENRLETDMVT